jgi:hypothetical protein
LPGSREDGKKENLISRLTDFPSIFLLRVVATQNFEGAQPAKQLKLDLALKPGELTIVAVALKYAVARKGTLKLITEERWLPAAIVGGCYGKMG